MSNPYAPIKRPRLPQVTPSLGYVRKGLQPRVQKAWNALDRGPRQKHLDRAVGDNAVPGAAKSKGIEDTGGKARTADHAQAGRSDDDKRDDD